MAFNFSKKASYGELVMAHRLGPGVIPEYRVIQTISHKLLKAGVDTDGSQTSYYQMVLGTCNGYRLILTPKTWQR
jgi:hypothetical protein